MKKMKNIVIFTIFVIMLFVSIAALNISLGFECSEKDLLLYRIGGFVLTVSYAIGFLTEFIISKFTNGIKNNPVKKRVVLWSSIVVFSIVAFVVCYGFTSNDFKNDMQTYNMNLNRSSENQMNIKETTKNNESSKINDKKKVKENEQTIESKEQEITDSKDNKQTVYQELSDQQFALLTEMVVKSFYSFNLDEKDYQRVSNENTVMECLKKIYNYAYENSFEIEPDYKKAVASRAEVVKGISNYNDLEDRFMVEYYRDSKKGEWVYNISSYSINPKDMIKSDNKLYVDAEGYLNPGVKLYWIEDGEIIEVGEVEDIAYNKQINGTAYAYAVKVEFYDDPYSSGWTDGENMLTANKKLSGKPLYYINVLDVCRKVSKEEINYNSSFKWKALNKSNAKAGAEVYFGVSNVKSYIFTIKNVDKKADVMSVVYPSGSVEKKSYSAMLNSGNLYIK